MKAQVKVAFCSYVLPSPFPFRLLFTRPLQQAVLTCFIWLCLIAPLIASAQSQSSEVQPAGVLRLIARPKVNGETTKLQRKRFYLIKGSLEENKALVDKISQKPFLTRECYYRNAKASEAFIKWLTTEGDCESVYCRPIEEEYLTGPSAVPEFQEAYERSVKEYKSPELGRLWLTTNLTSIIRDGFYRQKQDQLKALIGDAQSGTTTVVSSVMTDRTGTANFTHLPPGSYLVSNLIPIELGGRSISWTCTVTITNKLKVLQVASSKDCVPIENPLPACDANKHTASIR